MTPAVSVQDTERPITLPRPSAVRLGSFPANSDQDLRFVQDRMAMFAKTTFFISSMFLVATSLADLLGTVQRYSVLSRISHLLGTVLALGLWLIARGHRNRSPVELQTLDIASTFGICWCFAAMGHFAVQPYGFFTGLLAVTHVSISRAMIIPSIPLQTLLLGAGSFLGLIVSRISMPISSQIAEIAGPRGRGVLEACLWSTAGVAVAAVASKVIYGLHEKAREARQLGQYTLEDKIGAGGMGEVYRAHHAMLRRPTAVKLLSGDGSEDQLRRFEREVQLTARLTHPNTISIYDYGRTPEGIFYYAMELLEGLTLEQLIDRYGAQPPGRVIHLMLQACGALKEAHKFGLIHRDIKPANLYLCRRGEIPDFVKVLDFGLVRDIKAAENDSRSNINAVVGTPLYLSPESIVTPDRVDARADIYGLGCVAYHLIAGVPPFMGANLVELGAHHLHSTPPPPSTHQPVPADIEHAILSCLAKDCAQRPQTAQDLAETLTRCQSAHTWTETDAENWWNGVEHSGNVKKPPLTDEQTRRTVCCADLAHRFARPGNA